MGKKAKGGQARRKQKEVERRRKKARQRAAAPPLGEKARIMHARIYPFHEVFINEDWRESRLADIHVMRLQPNGQVAYGVFLVDLGCLGLKDAYAIANAN